MNILVTGGAGYIGRHICRLLKANGALPIVLDDMSTGRDPGPGFMFHGSLLDPHDLGRVISDHEPDGIIHLAAHSDVAESVRDPEKYRQNVMMTAMLAQAAEGIPTVFASSAAVYGEGGSRRLSEGAPLAPINPYGRSKADCEFLLPDAICLRLFNVIGGDGDEGAHLVPRVLKALVGRGAFVLNGDGSCVRDFVSVVDVAQAFVLALRAKIAGAPGQALNICSGVGRSVREVMVACERAAGLRLPTLPAAAHRPGDAARLVGDNTRAGEVLRWTPKQELDEAIASAWAAIRQEAAAWA